MALLSKGITLYQTEYKSSNGTPLGWEGVEDPHPTYGNAIPDLQEVGEIAGGADIQREKIEVTTLADDKHKYINGIQADTEHSEITFKFLYNPVIFKALVSLQKAEQEWLAANSGVDSEESGSTWTVTIPSGDRTTAYTLSALITSIKFDGASINGALTMSLTLKPVKAIDIA